jgi:hypothetical protein
VIQRVTRSVFVVAGFFVASLNIFFGREFSFFGDDGEKPKANDSKKGLLRRINTLTKRNYEYEAKIKDLETRIGSAPAPT